MYIPSICSVYTKHTTYNFLFFKFYIIKVLHIYCIYLNLTWYKAKRDPKLNLKSWCGCYCGYATRVHGLCIDE